MRLILYTIITVMLLPFVAQAQYVGSGRPPSRTEFNDSLAAKVDTTRFKADSANLATNYLNATTVRGEIGDSVAAHSSSGGGGGTAVTIGVTGSGATYEVASGGNGDSVLQVAMDSVKNLKAGGRTIGLFLDSLFVDDTVFVQAPFTELRGMGGRLMIGGAITAIVDTGGFDNWVIDGLRFVGDGTAHAAIGGKAGTDSVIVRNSSFESFTGSTSKVFAVDSLSAGWRFGNVVFKGNSLALFNGISSRWNGVDFYSSDSIGLAINWHRSDIYNVRGLVSGGSIGLALFSEGGTTLPGYTGGTYGTGGHLGNVDIMCIDSTSTNVCIEVNSDLFLARDMEGGSITGVNLGVLSAADKGTGINFGGTYQNNISVSGGTINGFLYGIKFSTLSYYNHVNGLSIVGGDTGVYLDGHNTVSGCLIRLQTTNGLNITANSTATSYGNLKMANNGTNVTNNGSGTSAGDTSGLY